MSSPTLTFTPAMFHASKTGRKNTTRRLITEIPPTNEFDALRTDKSPFSQVEDSSWIHTNRKGFVTTLTAAHQPGQIKPIVTRWAASKDWDDSKPCAIEKDILLGDSLFGGLWFDDGSKKPTWAGKTRPGYFLPKSLYSLALQVEILTVHPEFLHDITQTGASQEGIYEVQHDGNGLDLGYTWSNQQDSYDTPRIAYFALWDTINAHKAKVQYAATHNPACWVITYRLLTTSKP